MMYTCLREEWICMFQFLIFDDQASISSLGLLLILEKYSPSRSLVQKSLVNGWASTLSWHVWEGKTDPLLKITGPLYTAQSLQHEYVISSSSYMCCQSLKPLYKWCEPNPGDVYNGVLIVWWINRCTKIYMACLMLSRFPSPQLHDSILLPSDEKSRTVVGSRKISFADQY